VPHVLRGPFGLAFTPGSHLITSNGDAVNDAPPPIRARLSSSHPRPGREAAPASTVQIATVLAPRATFNFAAVNDNNNSVAVMCCRRRRPLAASPHRVHKAAPNFVGARVESLFAKIRCLGDQLNGLASGATTLVTCLRSMTAPSTEFPFVRCGMGK
jgi:hypothetical protein